MRPETEGEGDAGEPAGRGWRGSTPRGSVPAPQSGEPDGRGRRGSPCASEASAPAPPGGEPPPDYEIPEERLPEGFVDTVLEVPRVPAVPKASATVVVVREGAGGAGSTAGSRAPRGADEADAQGGPEVLLLRRNRATGFVPGAWVFPGGRVDAADGEAAMAGRWVRLTPERAAGRLGLGMDADPPAIAYYGAAVREAFEETGLLAGVVGGGGGEAMSGLHAAREALLGRGVPLARVLQSLGARIDGAAIEYIAHWVTPVAEPRRYDTRFFAARVPAGAVAVHDEREMTGSVWLTPRAALERHRAGDLPMIFPTIRTLEDLSEFATVGELLAHYRGRAIPRVQPEIVRTASGVALRVP